MLLRAALLSGTPCIEVWEAWQEAMPCVERLDPGDSWLLPLLYQNLRAQGIDGRLLARCEYVYRHTWYKNNLVLHHVAEVFSALPATIPLIWLKGIALSLLAYEDIAARPITHVDVWTPSEHSPMLLDNLARAGWLLRDSTQAEGFTPLTLTDSLGRILHIHHHIFGGEETRTFRPNLASFSIRRMPAHTLDPIDQLIHICANPHAWDTMSPLLWIADAATMIASQPRLDWACLSERATETGELEAVRSALQIVGDFVELDFPPTRACATAISHDLSRA